MLTKIQIAETNELVFDYFVYKNTPNVVIFVCEVDDKERISLLKYFNEFGTKVIFYKLNVTTQINYLLKSSYWKLGVFLDFRCYDDERITYLFLEASKNRLFGEIHCWLVLGADIDSVKNAINDSAFGLSTDFAIGLPTVNASYELYDVYNPWKEDGGRLNVTRMGYWSNHSGLEIGLMQSKFFRRFNLHGISMKAAFFASKYKPINVTIDDYLQDYTTQSKDGLSKFGYNILSHLSDMFNITFNFGEVQKWKEGDTIGPLSRALMSNEIQITGSPLVMTHERLRLIKFVYPTWPFRTCFIFRNPQPQDIKINEILRPFSVECWYTTFIFFIIFFIILGFNFQFEKDASNSRYLNSFIVVMGALCQQGINLSIDKISTRIICIYLLMFTLLTYNYYSASIVSARLNKPIFKINDSLIELAKMDLKLASEPMIYFKFIMNRLPAWARETFYVNRWMKVPEDDRFMYPDKAIEMVKHGVLAYHTHPDTSYPIIDRTFTFREICELTEVHAQKPVYATIAVTYNSSFVEMTKIGFAKISEVGIRNRQLIRWTSKKPRCRNDVINVSSTDIYEFAPHLIILAIGILLAGIILTLEIIMANYNYKNRIFRLNNVENCAILRFVDVLTKA